MFIHELQKQEKSLIILFDICILFHLQITWYRDSNMLSESDKTSFLSEENRHTLILRFVN